MGVPARVLAAGMAGCAAVVLAGGGIGSGAVTSRPAREPSLADLVKSMQTSVRGASSVRVTGHLTQNGTPLGVDLGLRRHGEMTGIIIENGAAAQVLAVAGKMYVQATPAFLQEMEAPAGACAAACGKWIQLTSPGAGQTTGDLSMTNMMSPLTSGQVRTLTESGSTTVKGQPAWVLRAADGSTLDVSAGNGHYPLAAAGSSSPRQVVVYSQWNKVPRPQSPPASQVLNTGGTASLLARAGPNGGPAPGTWGLHCWLCLPD